MSGRHTKIEVSMSNTKTRCILDNTFFPEINPGDKVSITYIMHWKECNDMYMKFSIPDVTSADVPPEGFVTNGFDDYKRDETGAVFLSNFDISQYKIYAQTIARFRAQSPERGNFIFLKDIGYGYCADHAYGSVWLTKNLGDLSDFWDLFQKVKS